MSYSHDVMFAQEGKDGKKRYTKVGAAFTTEKGISIKLEFVPVAVDPTKGLWLSLFEPKPRE